MGNNPFAAPNGNGTAPANGNPFGTPPPAPAMDGLEKADAERGTVVILSIKSVDRVTSKFADPKTGKFEEQDRLTVDVTVVDGDKAGAVYTDQWIFWNRVVKQFAGCAGDGRMYLVKLTMDGRAVVTEPVTDTGTIEKAAALVA